MRTFSLKDDTCFSGIRSHPSDREVVGGGYLEQGTRRLILSAYPEPVEGRMGWCWSGRKVGEREVEWTVFGRPDPVLSMLRSEAMQE